MWIVCLILQNWIVSKNTLVPKLIWKWQPSFNLKAVGNLKSTGRVCACESELWCEERRKPRREKKKEEEKVSQIKLRLTSCLHQTRCTKGSALIQSYKGILKSRPTDRDDGISCIYLGMSNPYRIFGVRVGISAIIRGEGYWLNDEDNFLITNEHIMVQSKARNC